MVNGGNYCCKCAQSIDVRYDPFLCLDSRRAMDDMHFYDEELTETIDIVRTSSDILQNCLGLADITGFNHMIERNLEISNSHFSSMFFNLDGNKSNFDTFAVEIERFAHTFSVIGIAETNSDKHENGLYPLNNYVSYYQNTHIGKSKGTGVALYAHKSLNVTVCDELSHTSPNLESIFVTITSYQTPITVGVIYRPPSGDKNNFLEELNQLFEQTPRKNVYILGDFNMDLHNICLDQEKQYEDLIITSGFTPLISLYTHNKPHCRKTCIDNILSNNPESICMSGTVKESLSRSHHLPIFQISNYVINDGQASNSNDAHIQYYDFCNTNIEQFVNVLGNTLTSTEDITFSDFNSAYNSVLDRTCKLESPKISKRNRKVNPWITDGIVASVNTKSMLYKKWCKSKTSDNPGGDIDKYNTFSVYRKNLKKIIKVAKSKYYCKKIYEHEGNMKKTWAVINELRGKYKTPIKPDFIIDNNRITDRRVIANEFNKYFVSLAAKMNNEVYDQPGIPINTFVSFERYLHNSKRSTNSIYLQDCTSDEVNEIIINFENGKSSDIPVRLVKASSSVISPVLSKLFNNLMQNGIFPEELKLGNVTPIYKKDNKQLLENYRPISTLPIFGKLFEKVIYSRLYSFFTAKCTLSKNQYGFRKNHSTSHALNYSVRHIENCLKNDKYVLGIFIDLSKAFDTLDHGLLLTKLERYGIRGNALNLINSYLTARSQFTTTLNEKSDTLQIRYGVPQGSVLGPLLFLVYINDISKCSNLGNLVLFADDTNVFVEDKCKYTAYEKANTVLKSIHDYMRANKLHINIKKCCYMQFNPHRRNKNKDCDINNYSLELRINNSVIEKVSNTKFLGVIIDEELTWRPHVEYLSKKLRCSIGSLNRIKDYIPVSLHKSLYHTLFESHLSYGISVWGGVSRTHLDKLFVLQKKCLRILFGNKDEYLDKFMTSARARPLGKQTLGSEFYARENSKPLFTRQNIMTVHNVHKYHTLLLFFKIMKLRSPIELCECFNMSRRKGTLILTPLPSINFVYQASFLWNIFRNIVNIEDFSYSLGKFKTTLKKAIHVRQKLGDPIEWSEENFELR